MELIYKIASEPEEFKQIYKLNYQTFVEEIPQHHQNEQLHLVDRFDQENLYVIAKRKDEVVGMIAIRSNRPFSLDEKIANLNDFLPIGANPCEIRLLSIKEEFRKSPVFYKLCELLVSYCLEKDFNMALISGVELQIPLYKRMGFQPFGEMVGNDQVKFQPMYLTKEQFEISSKVFKRLMARQQKVQKTRRFLPGPVSLHPSVEKAFALPSLSHRSQVFLDEINQIRTKLCQFTNSNYAEIIVGTGTLGNDLVAGQLEKLPGKGLILANGEFGYRLIDHASRFDLSFYSITKEWNEKISSVEVEQFLKEHDDISWLWTVHCETSTGFLYDVEQLETICANYKVELCIDACSSVGIVPTSFKNVLFATTVSGKGLGSYPGLVIVLHREKIQPSASLPRYLDLGMYQDYDSVPYTHSSNLVKALHVAIGLVDINMIVQKATSLRESLKNNGYEFLGDSTYSPGIITIQIPTTHSSRTFGDKLKNKGLIISYESEYLIQRNWIQVSLMGYHETDEMNYLNLTMKQINSALAQKVYKND